MMDGYMGVGMAGMAGMAGMGLAVLVWTLVVLGLVVVAVLAAAHALRRPASTPRRAPAANEDWSAEDVLRMRYARGELDADDFRRRMQDLHEV
jgi:putative membrane protein